MPPIVPELLVTLLLTRLFFVAAGISDKCARVPALVNSLSFGPDTEQRRQLLTDYIVRSDAGLSCGMSTALSTPHRCKLIVDINRRYRWTSRFGCARTAAATNTYMGLAQAPPMVLARGERLVAAGADELSA